MAILNYTTTVSADKTIGEIYTILTKAGASEIVYENNNGQVSALRFVILIEDQPMQFRMAPRPDGVLKAMIRDNVQRKFRNAKQAHRTAWRILKDAIEAQLAIYQTQQGEISEIFLPYALDSKGESFHNVLMSERRKAIGAGG